jgi:hypothetical protein
MRLEELTRDDVIPTDVRDVLVERSMTRAAPRMRSAIGSPARPSRRRD